MVHAFSLADTFISWSDPEAGLRISLSFQDAAGCSLIWYVLYQKYSHVATGLILWLDDVFHCILSMLNAYLQMMANFVCLQGHDLQGTETPTCWDFG